MAELIRDLVRTGAIVIIDTPPLLLSTDPAVLAHVTDGALLVTRFRSTRVDELSVGASALRTAGATLLGLVLNRVPRRPTRSLPRISTHGYRFGRTSQLPTKQPLQRPVRRVAEPDQDQTVITPRPLRSRTVASEIRCKGTGAVPVSAVHGDRHLARGLTGSCWTRRCWPGTWPRRAARCLAAHRAEVFPDAD